MNPLVKLALNTALDFIIDREPTFASHKSAEVQKIGAEVVAGARELLKLMPYL